jgi:hypothetical protein
MKAAIPWLFGAMALGAIVSCSEAGGQVPGNTALPGSSGYDGAASMQDVHLGTQWYSTHLTGAAQLDQLLQETSHHGNGNGG